MQFSIKLNNNWSIHLDNFQNLLPIYKILNNSFLQMAKGEILKSGNLKKKKRIY